LGWCRDARCAFRFGIKDEIAIRTEKPTTLKAEAAEQADGSAARRLDHDHEGSLEARVPSLKPLVSSSPVRAAILVSRFAVANSFAARPRE
jgi:hypothetical protein